MDSESWECPFCMTHNERPDWCLWYYCPSCDMMIPIDQVEGELKDE